MRKPVNALQLPISEIFVRAVDGTLKTSSLNVAAIFGKNHKNVLRAIDNLDCSPEFTALNFEPSEYLDPTGRSVRMFDLTKDGFTFLVMGFTGEGAAIYKEAYIARFNAMETELRRRTVSPSLAKLHLARVKLLDKLKSERSEAVQRALHEQLAVLSADMGLCCPALAAVAPPQPKESPDLARFWAVYHGLQANPETRVNHACKPGLIAINLRHFRHAAQAAGLEMPYLPTSTLRQSAAPSPRYHSNTAVYSRLLSRAVRCFVFQE